MAELVIPGITDSNTLACISRARTYVQYMLMVENALKDLCPFCKIDRTHNNIVAENKYWYAWPCNPPEANTKFHFLFVPKRHVTDSEQLRDVELIWLFGEAGIRRQVREKYGYTSRGTMMRDGDATLSAGTIQHLHVHDMVPNETGRVESPFYKGIEAEKESTRRAIVFEKLRTGSLIARLDAEEQALIRGRA